MCHYPTDWPLGRVAGLGMNAKELELNPQLTERTLRDLNKQPSLPYADASFDVVTCVVSAATSATETVRSHSQSN